MLILFDKVMTEWESVFWISVLQTHVKETLFCTSDMLSTGNCMTLSTSFLLLVWNAVSQALYSSNMQHIIYLANVLDMGKTWVDTMWYCHQIWSCILLYIIGHYIQLLCRVWLKQDSNCLNDCNFPETHMFHMKAVLHHH